MVCPGMDKSRAATASTPHGLSDTLAGADLDGAGGDGHGHQETHDEQSNARQTWCGHELGSLAG
jgi:hypothetical protein